jgi:hypothetical protein
MVILWQYLLLLKERKSNLLQQEYIFKSERLGFRNWLDSDLYPMTELNNDIQVMEFFPNLQSYKETQEFIEIIQKS